MSVRMLPRELGAVIRCNFDHCQATITTGQILAGGIRAYAKTQGWSKGGAGDSKIESRKRWDICPAHVPVEKKRIAEMAKAKAARLDARDKARLERDAKIAEKHAAIAARKAARAAARAERARVKASKPARAPRSVTAREASASP